MQTVPEQAVDARAPVDVPPGLSAQAAGVLVWEAVVGERSQPLGYRFFLSEAATLRVRGGARVRQFLDAMLVSHVAAISPTWRSHRQIFLRLDAEALDPTALAQLGGAGVHLILDADARGEPAS
ncbi:MAG TPA: hypothetical protein PK620_09400, partial [Denitromonas sp.]|nr:hypothetical protein [Denitromonas sp.]